MCIALDQEGSKGLQFDEGVIRSIAIGGLRTFVDILALPREELYTGARQVSTDA